MLLNPTNLVSLRALIFHAGILLGLLSVSAAAQEFGFEDVAARARKVASAPYVRPQKNLPKALTALSYDQYRDIRFNPDKAHWRNERLPFELAFFHQGFSFDSPVRIHEIAGRSVKEIKFDPKLFNYGANQLNQKELGGLGFAGFRVHYPINTPKYKDEVIVFLGASYFRAVGKGQLYGLSSRGLAIDTGLASGEEFPQFVEFWIQKPQPLDKELTIYALLDSARAAGAYRFVVRPGIDTAVDVKARLFLRENVSKLGIAPLTSMFYFGENHKPGVEDYRPEVHDSDGLSVQSGTGEWLWRPLVNPRRLLITSFGSTNPAGFGLMQRDRNFSSYEDLEANYQRRPSAWIEPKGNWGPGRVELVQIPTPDETNDNVVSYWVPDTPPKPGAPLDLEYRMLWQKESDRRPPLAWVSQTRRGHGYVRKPDDSIALTIDFDGPALQRLEKDIKLASTVTTDSNAKLLEVTTYPNEVSGGWRTAIRLRRIDEKKPVELRAYLRNNNITLSETWSYILPPE